MGDTLSLIDKKEKYEYLAQEGRHAFTTLSHLKKIRQWVYIKSQSNNLNKQTT